MPLKLMGTVVLMVIVGIFCGFNTSETHRCDINLIFVTLHGIPVFLTVLMSFLGGVLVMAPFTLRRGRRESADVPTPAEEKPPISVPQDSETTEVRAE